MNMRGDRVLGTETGGKKSARMWEIKKCEGSDGGVRGRSE